MSHKRKDTYCPPPEWAKHLRPHYKRVAARNERRYVFQIVNQYLEEMHSAPQETETKEP